jgi:hypothetical protein
VAADDGLVEGAFQEGAGDRARLLIVDQVDQGFSDELNQVRPAAGLGVEGIPVALGAGAAV